MDKDSKQPETRFQKIYAVIFLTVLLAGIGGGICVWGGQSAIGAQKAFIQDPTSLSTNKGGNLFEIFVLPGLRDWRVQFAIGATIGAACAIRFNIRSWRSKE